MFNFSTEGMATTTKHSFQYNEHGKHKRSQITTLVMLKSILFSQMKMLLKPAYLKTSLKLFNSAVKSFQMDINPKEWFPWYMVISRNP